jgi:hypothetical protein
LYKKSGFDDEHDSQVEIFWRLWKESQKNLFRIIRMIPWELFRNHSRQIEQNHQSKIPVEYDDKSMEKIHRNVNNIPTNQILEALKDKLKKYNI